MASNPQTDLATELARRLRAARHLSGKKVPELARDLGWSKEKIYRLEQARQVPDALELAEIASATDQAIEFFYVGFTSSAGAGAILSASDEPDNAAREAVEA